MDNAQSTLEISQTQDLIFPVERGAQWDIEDPSGFRLAKLVATGTDPDDPIQAAAYAPFCEIVEVNDTHIIVRDTALQCDIHVRKHPGQITILAPKGHHVRHMPPLRLPILPQLQSFFNRWLRTQKTEEAPTNLLPFKAED